VADRAADALWRRRDEPIAKKPDEVPDARESVTALP